MTKYRVSELARLLGVSDVAIRKRIKNGEFKTVKETFNKRNITFICLDAEQIEELKLNEISEGDKLQNIFPDNNNDEIKKLISNCLTKYENFYGEYLSNINSLNEKNAILTAENTKLKAQLSSVITKYNNLAKRVNASLAKKKA